jgi:hypothetical protein
VSPLNTVVLLCSLGLNAVQSPINENPSKSSIHVAPKHGSKWEQIEAVSTFTPLQFAAKMFPPTLNM